MGKDAEYSLRLASPISKSVQENKQNLFTDLPESIINLFTNLRTRVLLNALPE